jgi:hypothetical protein
MCVGGTLLTLMGALRWALDLRHVAKLARRSACRLLRFLRVRQSLLTKLGRVPWLRCEAWKRTAAAMPCRALRRNKWGGQRG